MEETENNSLTPVKYFLKPGYVFVSVKPAVISAVVGSCVIVCLYDTKRKVGGMNNYQLPNINEQNKATARYGNVAIFALTDMMLKDGSQLKNLEAQIVGGAVNREFDTNKIGVMNVNIAKKILKKKKIRVVSEDIGGEKGRKVVFNTSTNELAILKVDTLRDSDWYPYKEER
jgi:chemotaxis protein CheD